MATQKRRPHVATVLYRDVAVGRFLTDVGDAEYYKQSKYRSYTDEIVAVLQSFDRAKEWADLIKCLQKLQKVRSPAINADSSSQRATDIPLSLSTGLFEVLTVSFDPC